MNHELLKLLDLDEPFLSPDDATRLAKIVEWFPPMPKEHGQIMSPDYQDGFREAIKIAAAAVLAAGGVDDYPAGCAPVASPPASDPVNHKAKTQ